MNTITHITMDDAHTFAQGLIAHGWLNSDLNCVDTLYRQLVEITKLPNGYQLAVIEATPEMEQAGRAVGVNASWSYAKCYRGMLDAQPGSPPPWVPARGKPIGYMPKWAAAHMSDEAGGHRGWGVTTHIYREPLEGYVAVYLTPPPCSGIGTQVESSDELILAPRSTTDARASVRETIKVALHNCLAGKAAVPAQPISGQE